MANFNSCPNCGQDSNKKRNTGKAYVAECKECGATMCNLCGDHSMWSGAKCPRCGSSNTKDIGRIV